MYDVADDVKQILELTHRVDERVKNIVEQIAQLHNRQTLNEDKLENYNGRLSILENKNIDKLTDKMDNYNSRMQDVEGQLERLRKMCWLFFGAVVCPLIVGLIGWYIFNMRH